MLYFLFIYQVFSDNIEISISSFDQLIIEDYVIDSKHCTQHTSVKISHPGFYIYRLVELEPRVFKLVDTTVYFEKTQDLVYRVDFENKYYGLVKDTWMLVVVLFTTSLLHFLATFLIL